MELTANSHRQTVNRVYSTDIIIENTMERNEAWLWLTRINKAKQGDPEALEMIRVENELRQENNRPSLEDELMAMVK
jgi:hypothetical protein